MTKETTMKLPFTLTAPCHFGLEAVLKRELTDLGCEILRVEDGKVHFRGDADTIALANIFVRTAERILLTVGEVHAATFDELFEATRALPWEDYIPQNGRFWVTKANSVKSRLFSPSDIQSIMKKAIVERLRQVYHVSWFPEDGPAYPIRVSLMKDIASVGLDTSGASLHKRGYRKSTVKAPITETLASALLMLTPWKPGRILVDPFCGSGTFPIEAAMMAAGIAPGAARSFQAGEWENLVPALSWKSARERAADPVHPDIRTDIQGYDIDPAAVSAARDNARLAGVAHLIHLQQRDVSQLRHARPYGFVIANPPYGERLKEEDLKNLYSTLGQQFRALDRWSMYLITSYEKAEEALGLQAARNRKIYNGMLKTYFYQFPGPKPPRQK